jgi:hypothetical protein
MDRHGVLSDHRTTTPRPTGRKESMLNMLNLKRRETGRVEAITACLWTRGGEVNALSKLAKMVMLSFLSCSYPSFTLQHIPRAASINPCYPLSLLVLSIIHTSIADTPSRSLLEKTSPLAQTNSSFISRLQIDLSTTDQLPVRIRLRTLFSSPRSAWKAHHWTDQGDARSEVRCLYP